MSLWVIFGLIIKASLGSPSPFSQNTQRQITEVTGVPEAPFIIPLLSNTLPYVLPMFDKNASSRAEEISNNRAGYSYGPSLLGNTSYYPNGTLGDALVQQDVEYYLLDVAVQVASVTNDSQKVLETIEGSPVVEHLASYDILYNEQWKESLPLGIAPGALSNYTQDLFFSMERLTSNPFVVRRLLISEQLPFIIDDTLTKQITGLASNDLKSQGRLFYADHSYQSNATFYPVGEFKYTAACQAYFFISPFSGEFLPLGIKLNCGSELVYTPLDSANDWLLAKILFNVNDLFHSQMFHLAASHATSEIVYEAALRSLSIRHPIRGFLDSLMYQAFAPRTVGKMELFNPGGPFDQVFSIGAIGAENFATTTYAATAGHFRANYLETDFLNRGLFGCAYGPPLISSPYFEDASVILASMRQFLTSYVDLYYTESFLIIQDHELQNWIAEANGPANVLDFPESITTKSELVEVLVHQAFLSGVHHHILNGNSLPTLPGVLPFHPAAVYSPIPQEKGITSPQLLAFLPNLTQSLRQAALITEFNRPLLKFENKSLPYMFKSPQFVGDIGSDLDKAAQAFEEQMMALSAIIGARKFDEQGLSQGMPFVWQALDPQRIPFFLVSEISQVNNALFQ